MKLKETSPSNLSNRQDRAIAKLARIARYDVLFGRCEAVRLLRYLKLSPNAHEFETAVNAAYSSSTGNARNHLAYECPECGSACLGQEKAMLCCQPSEEGDEFDPEIEELARVSSEEFYEKTAYLAGFPAGNGME